MTSHRRVAPLAFFLLLFWCILPPEVTPLASTKSTGSRNKQTRAKKTPAASGSSGTGFGAVSSSTTFVHTPDTSPSTATLLQFLTAQKAKGLDQVGIGMHQDTGIRGLFCKQNIKKGQIICQIPSDCALALSDPSQNGDDCPTVAHGGANLMTMYLQNEQARQLWSPYLDTLPQQPQRPQQQDDADGTHQVRRLHFDPTPDYLCEDDLALLEFPRIIEKTQERNHHIDQVAAERGLDRDELQFATWLVSSRAFELTLSEPEEEIVEGKDGDSSGGYVMPKHDERGQIISKTRQKSIRVLVPFLDFCNHNSDQPNCKLTLIDPEKDDAWFALEATRPITAGKELVISYGNGVESSVELLLDYGFVPSSNKVDMMMLKKGGEGCIASLDGWTTTLEEDRTMLEMAQDDPVLQKILRFRIRLKESYDA